jgi:hypothetical protein
VAVFQLDHLLLLFLVVGSLGLGGHATQQAQYQDNDSPFHDHYGLSGYEMMITMQM